MGHKKLTVELQEKITKIPENLLKYNLEVGEELMSLIYTYNVQATKTGITDLLKDLKDTGLKLKDLKTEQSSLEKIFQTKCCLLIVLIKLTLINLAQCKIHS